MAANLGLDALIDELANLAGSATGSWSKLQTLLNRFKSDSSDNLLGSAALKDVGTGQGNVPELGTGGKLDEDRLPEASTTEKGIIEIATTSQVSAGAATDLAVTPAGLNARLGNISTQNDSLLDVAVYTSIGTHTWSRSTGVTKVLVVALGGGGAAGSGIGAGSPGLPGYAQAMFNVSSIASATVTVGGKNGTSKWVAGSRHVTATGGTDGSGTANGADGAGSSSGAFPGSSLLGWGPVFGYGGGGPRSQRGFVIVYEYR